MSSLTRGLTVFDTAGTEWLRFEYEVDTKIYDADKGFLTRYLLGKFI
jgi:hypothetical protein